MDDLIEIMKKTLKISAAVALTMSVASCGTARSVSQENGTQQVETQPAADTLSNHGTPMPEGFVPTHPPVVVPHRWNE